jgi:plastocyanin
VKSLIRAVAVVAAACALTAGCADDGPSPVEAGEQPGPTDAVGSSVVATETVTVQAIDNTFRPDRIEIAPGTEVVWVNRGRNEHDLLSDSDLEFGAVAADFQPGDEYRYVFTEPGEYPYHCTIHGTHEIGMTGTVVVTDTA